MPSNCLIVIDMQNDFLDGLEGCSRAGLISRANRLVGLFRAAACPVIWIQTSFNADLSDAFLEMRDRGIAVVVDGTKGAGLDSGLAKQEEDTVITKKRYSAFFGTDLEKILSNLAPDHITLAGVNTHACVRTTAIDAYQRDMRVIIASECVESIDKEHARISMAYMDNKIAVAMTNDEISDAMNW